MKYIKVNWHHDGPEDPITLYAEIDDDMWELRKVEVYLDGTMGYADKYTCIHSMGISIERIPSFEEIASQPEFDLCEISFQDFEDMWVQAKSGGSSGGG